MAVLFQDVQQHLNLPGTADEVVVTRLIAAATDWLESQLGYKIAVKYPTAVPPALNQAVLMMVGHWYENREASLVGVNAQALPMSVSDIVNDYRNWTWGADA